MATAPARLSLYLRMRPPEGISRRASTQRAKPASGDWSPGSLSALRIATHAHAHAAPLAARNGKYLDQRVAVFRAPTRSKKHVAPILSVTIRLAIVGDDRDRELPGTLLQACGQRRLGRVGKPPRGQGIGSGVPSGARRGLFAVRPANGPPARDRTRARQNQQIAMTSARLIVSGAVSSAVPRLVSPGCQMGRSARIARKERFCVNVNALNAALSQLQSSTRTP